MVALERLMGLPLIWLGVALALLVLRRKLLSQTSRWAAASATPLEERAARMLTWLYVPAGLLAGGYLSIQLVPLPSRWQTYAERGLGALAVLLAAWVGWRTFSLLLNHWAESNPNAKTLVPPLELFGRVFGAVLGIALVFSALGFSLTKVWAALGIGSVAIALALQDTLSNSFAGLHIMLDQPFRTGDYIRLDSGEEGRVIRIGWRSTRLQTAPNNILVIPNSKLSRASITNFSLPQPRLALTIMVPVSYGSDTRRVRAALDDLVGQAAREVDGLLSEPPPAVRFAGFGDHSLNFSLVCQVRDFTAQQPVQDEMHYRIVEGLKREGIEMVSPAGPFRPLRSDPPAAV